LLGLLLINQFLVIDLQTFRQLVLMLQEALFIVLQFGISLKHCDCLVSSNAKQHLLRMHVIDGQELFVLKLTNHNTALLDRFDSLLNAHSHHDLLSLSHVTHLMGVWAVIHLLFAPKCLLQSLLPLLPEFQAVVFKRKNVDADCILVLAVKGVNGVCCDSGFGLGCKFLEIEVEELGVD
jgi:hypothetical protein